MSTNNILLIKNMVCHRCVLSVEEILRHAGIAHTKVQIGEIHLEKEITEAQRAKLVSGLARVGFELIDNRTGALVERIKQLVIKKARNEVNETERKANLSVYLSGWLYLEYTYLSSLFSSVEGRTIENFFIEQRIEMVKELLTYGQMTLSEIALQLDYSSTAHLSSQFKKVTGLTPSHFKQVGVEKRKALDEV